MSRLLAEVAPVSASSGTRYRVGLHVRHESALGDPATAPLVRFVWHGEGDRITHGEWITATEVRGAISGFTRYETDPEGVVAPLGSAWVGVEIDLPPTARVSAIDDIFVSESIRPCFDACED
jgi:hypothetical protein